MSQTVLTEQRIDKWLWVARFFKTRSQAADAVNGGRVHVGGQRVKPSKPVRIDTRVNISRGETEFDVVVRGIIPRRGPATVAATLYEELPESIERRATEALARREAARMRAERAGRPSKRDRRALTRLKTGDPEPINVVDNESA